MRHLHSRSLAVALAVVLVLSWSTAHSYSIFSQAGGDSTNCGACHGDFRATNYISATDGTDWGNLHDLHRNTMLGGDCNTCHEAGGRFPVRLNRSVGGDGLSAISCMGCHGREEDNNIGNPQFPDGRGAGLRQHHFNAGIFVCLDCHEDADPTIYTTVGENILPDYYANPGIGHPDMPVESCNSDGSENFAGAPEGTDNDGDGVYDGDDTDCAATGAPEVAGSGAVLVESFPNPFVSDTVIRYSLRRPGEVRLSVFTVTGQLVRELADGYQERAGTYEVRWDGRDGAGNESASGTYLVRVETNDYTASKTVVMLR